jgi:triphosphoribosyl-dephospho-CoA synthase
MTNRQAQPLGLFAQLACVWEASARKPGNVHRFQDFVDVTYLDFVASAAAMAPVFSAVTDHERGPGVGEIVLAGVRATRMVVSTNTNLGILLLLAPLAKASKGIGLPAGVLQVLEKLTVADADSVYQAIRLAAPAGLGRVEEQDVSQPPTGTLRQVMALAADRDLIARQYANGFEDVLQMGVPALEHRLEETGGLEDAIIACHLDLLAHYPDSLIARKCGLAVAQEASRRAALVIGAGGPRTSSGRCAIAEFDCWLRADGHSRNPGTTADLVAACLFVSLREGIIKLPLEMPWSAGVAAPKK